MKSQLPSRGVSINNKQKSKSIKTSGAERYDWIIIGAGLYGLYSALELAKKGKKILILEYEAEAFTRATYINQARVHLGYHYPRSLSTAVKSAGYFDRFNREFSYAVNKDFEKIYAISDKFSLASGDQFEKFCGDAKIPCHKVDEKKYFKENLVEAAFETREYAFDAKTIKEKMLCEVSGNKNIKIEYNARLKGVEIEDALYKLTYEGKVAKTPKVLNATYASTNQIINLFGFEGFKIKYEICEMILVNVNEAIKNVGLTVMDGPFFSIMPFGLEGVHSLTSVTFTPHKTSYDKLPTFDCQERNPHCSPKQLGNCNTCPNRPKTAWPQMSQLANKYLADNIEFSYRESLFAIKPIAKASEMDDSRPTIILRHRSNPSFISVLSGKINTIYDLEEILNEE